MDWLNFIWNVGVWERKTHLISESLCTFYRATGTPCKISQIINNGIVTVRNNRYMLEIRFSTICNRFSFAIAWLIPSQHFSKTYNQLVSHFAFNSQQKIEFIFGDWPQISNIYFIVMCSLLNPIASITSFNNTHHKKENENKLWKLI